MLARLQRAITFGLLATALLWAAYFAQRGEWRWACGAAALILLGYALFMAVEFALVRAVHADDPAPRASAAQLLRAWWGEVTSAPLVFCWRQPFREHAQPDHLGEGVRGRRGVVLVHGFVCNRGLWNPWMRALRRLGVPFVAISLEPVFGSIDDYPPAIEDAVRRVETATGLAPVVVAHSMGGLALRAWLDAFGAEGRIHRAVTIGTPHHGTWLAKAAVTPNGLQMRRGSPWLRELASREPTSRAGRFTCFYGHCDNIVFPASTATLPGAENLHLDATAHVHMVAHPLVFSAVCGWLGVSGSTVAGGTRPTT